MRNVQIALLVITALQCSIVEIKAAQKDLPKASSEVSFKIKNAGLNVDGKFEQFTTNISYDKENPEKTTFQGTIQVASVNTGVSMRDGHLLKPDYFDAEKYPEIKFTSQSVKKVSAKQLTVSGVLSIRDVKKPVTLEIDIEENTGKKVFTTSLQINRRDYGVGGKSWMMSDDVKIYIQIVE